MKEIKLTKRETKILKVLFEKLNYNTSLKGNEISYLKRELSTDLKIKRDERYYSL